MQAAAGNITQLYGEFGRLLLAGDAPPPAAGPNYISPLQVALSAAVILVNAVISLTMQLGLEWQLIIGAVRCIVQLSLLGYILKPIFDINTWWLVLPYSCFMLLVGSYEAQSRPAYTYKGIFLHVTSCIGASAAMFLTYALLLVVRTQPWWEAQYFIPILGMILGNAISGVSVGLTTLLEEFISGRDKIELLLSIGASRWEATKAVIQRSVRVACTPILNQMNVVGIVSIPGMMTGQILGGSDPSQAARYQMVILFSIAATTSVASVAVITLASFYIVDGKARLRSDRLAKKDKANSWSSRLGNWLLKAGGHTIILVQATQQISSRTFYDYKSVHAAAEGICKLFEKRLKELNPTVPNITYDVKDLFNFIDKMYDMSALVYDPQPKVYVPYGKNWLKDQVMQHLQRQVTGRR